MKPLLQISMLVLTAALLPACASNKAPADWAAVVIDLKPADTLPLDQQPATLERPWIGFGLANPKDAPPDATPPTPSTLHVRLRTGAIDASDPKASGLEMMEVRGIDIGRPSSGEVLARAPVVIAVDPPAASITLTGSLIDWPYGKEPVVGGLARITFHRGYVDAAREADPKVDAHTLLRAALMGVTTADLRHYAQLELQPSIPEMIELVQARVAPSEIHAYYAAGYGFGVDELLSLKRAGVSVEDAVQFSDGGFLFTAPQLVRLHEQGVTPAYAIGMKQAGFARDVDMLIRLHAAGVQPAYAQRMRDLGVAPSIEPLVRLHEHAITPESVETFQKAKYDFGAEQLIELQAAGVSPQDTLYFREAGYDFSREELTRLAKWKVPASFTLALVSDDFELLSADQIIDLRLRRITPEQVRLLRQTRALELRSPGDSGAAARAPMPFPEPPPLDPLSPVDPAERDTSRDRTRDQ